MHMTPLKWIGSLRIVGCGRMQKRPCRMSKLFNVGWTSLGACRLRRRDRMSDAYGCESGVLDVWRRGISCLGRSPGAECCAYFAWLAIWAKDHTLPLWPVFTHGGDGAFT